MAVAFLLGLYFGGSVDWGYMVLLSFMAIVGAYGRLRNKHRELTISKALQTEAGREILAKMLVEAETKAKAKE